MDIENVKVLFASNDADSSQDLLTIFKERDISMLVVSDIQDLEYVDVKMVSDLVVLDLANMDEPFLQKVIAGCEEDDYPMPVVFISSGNEKELLLSLLQKMQGSVITRPFEDEKIFSLLDKILKTINIKKKIDVEHQYYNALMQTAIVSKTDPEGKITYVNDNFCELSEYSRDGLLGKPHNIVRHPEMLSETFRDMWDTIKQKKMWHGKIKNLKKGGDYYITNVVIVPLLDEYGKIVEYMAIRNDITQIEQMHEKIERAQERKKEILHKQQILEEIDKAKDEFLIVFTHELKTPLNAIINFSEYVAKHIKASDIEKKDKLLGLLLSVKMNGMEMLENIANIIDLSKLKAGKIDMHFSIIDANRLIDEILLKFSPIIEQNRIEVLKELNEECYIKSDGFRLSQVISNIFSNALKYGNKKVHIETKCKNGKIFIAIDDNGKGISEKEKIFELYEQGDADKVTRKTKGTGVGLHFVKYLSKELNIDIAVEDSELLGGARFVIKEI